MLVLENGLDIVAILHHDENIEDRERTNGIVAIVELSCHILSSVIWAQ